MTALYSPAPPKLGSPAVGHGHGESSPIISSSSTSSSEGTGSMPHSRDRPSNGGGCILRRFTACSDDVGRDEIRGTSVAGAWVRGNGDEARCRLSISAGFVGYDAEKDHKGVRAVRSEVSQERVGSARWAGFLPQ